MFFFGMYKVDISEASTSGIELIIFLNFPVMYDRETVNWLILSLKAQVSTKKDAAT